MKTATGLNWVIVLAAASLIFTAGCVPTGYTVGGKVSGVVGNLGLSLNGIETLAINKNGLYKFATSLPTGTAYGVTVATQPAGQTCSVVNGSGVIASANIRNVNVICQSAQYRVGGAVTGLLGVLSIQLNAAEILTINGDGAYQFTSNLQNGSAYSVAITEQPAGQECAITNGSGNINLADASVAINCITTAKLPVITHIWPNSALGGYEVKVSGSNLDLGTIAYNGAAIEPTLRTPHELRFSAPENPGGTYTLELENIAGVTSQSLAQGTVTTGVGVVSSGNSHSCAVLGNGTVQCWGGNYAGQLGNGTVTETTTPVTVVGIATAISVSAGAGHSCALLADHGVKCWGFNVNGQLGNGSNINSSTPVTVSGIHNAVSIAASGGHTCAALSTGAVKCWGLNGSGQLGNGTNTNSLIPVTVSGLASAVAVATGDEHSCALRSSGAVRCWGDGTFGQLGNGAFNIVSSIPVAVSGITDAVSISVGNDHGCAVLATGAIRCWGRNSGYGELGDGTRIDRATPVAVTGIDNAVSVGAGYWFTCATLSTGAAQCWGNGDTGQLGNGARGSDVMSLTPVTAVGLTNAVAVSGGYSHSCAAIDSGEVRCWGSNDYRKLGRDSASASSTAVTVAGITNATSIAGNGASSSNTYYGEHNCARLGTGEVQCWGWNKYGQLGNGTKLQSFTPVTVTGISDAISVSAASSDIAGHSCAVLGNQTIKCWGFNNSSQLGDGTTTNSTTPVTVTGIGNALAVSAGGKHSCAVLSNGTIKCWGSNASGQLGDGTTTYSATPVTVTGITNAVSVTAASSATGEYSCAVLSSGSIKCWGYNGNGQLGDGTKINSANPVTVTAINSAIAVSAGGKHSCAVLNNGTIKCWGYNVDGQLGNASTIESTSPVTVSSLNTAVLVSAGGDHTCAAANTGAVWCWGANYSGQLGSGNMMSSSTPQQVTGIDDAIAISAGSSHSCAVLDIGQIQCWGDNYSGQLTIPSDQQAQPGLPVYSR